ncbi:MAG: glycosyltransferase family 4 protein [Clostridiaceae bacterium]
MNISIDGRGINLYHGTGIGTYTDNLVNNLLKIDKANEYLIYWCGDNYKKYIRSNTNIYMTSKKHHNFFQNYYFPESSRKNNIDIHHIPQNGIGLFSEMKCQKVVTIHDLIPYIMPETVGRGYLIKFLEEMPVIIKEASKIITVSEYSKNDIIKFFPNAENKVFVTPLATNEIYKPINKTKCKKYLNDNYNISSPFLLYVGGFSPRKNVRGLLFSFARLCKEKDFNLRLVIAGSIREEKDVLIELCKKLNIFDKIIFTGFIKENELPIFYNCCETFIYPSLYEGFGLPPLEAMSCGTVVITSNLTSIPEVVKDGGILINPYDSDELYENIVKVLSNPSYKRNLKKKALAQSKEFSWEITAKKTLEVYEMCK